MDAGAYPGFAHRGQGHGVEPPEEPPSASMDDSDLLLPRHGCCYFCIPYFGSGPSAPAAGRGGGAWARIGDCEPATAAPSASSEEPWWRRALMKVREWSEIVAGPRWKTFIRRKSRHHRRRSCGFGSGGGGGGGGGPRHGKFQYDPLSYALNFDEGLRGHDADADGDYVYRDFSARFVLPPSSAKSSMDLGGRDAPPLFSAL